MGDTFLTYLANIMALVTSGVALYISVKKGHADVRGTDASTASTYADVADKYAARVEHLQEELDKAEKRRVQDVEALRTQMVVMEVRRDAAVEERTATMLSEIEGLKVKVEECNHEIAELVIQNHKLEVWAKKLAKQVVELGGVPLTIDEVAKTL